MTGQFHYDGDMSYRQESYGEIQIPNWKETAKTWLTRLLIICILVGAMLAAAWLADPEAKADVQDMGNGIVCQTDPAPQLLNWIRKRTLCDAPVRIDGSWVRARGFWTPAHQVPFSCYGSRYYSSCSGGYFVDPAQEPKDSYIVFPENVLPDEPGHIG